MSYTTLLSEESAESQFLVVVKPRKRLTGWTLISGTKYSQTFSHGELITIYKASVLQTQASSSALSDGIWYYDTTTMVVYIDFSGDANSTSIHLIGIYELYISTFDAYWYRVPTDSSTRTVYYEPLVTKSPQILSTISDALFGFLPSESSSLIVSNATQFFQDHLYDSSFYRASIDVYHWLDELTIANTSLIFKGLCSGVSSNDNEITMNIISSIDIFNKEYRHASGDSFFNPTTFTQMDPDFERRPIRTVIGVVNGFVPVNVGYVSNDPTTSDNRNWVCINDTTNLCNISTTNPGGSNTATRTYLTSAQGFRVGDSVWIDSSLGAGFDEFVIVTNVNYSANWIEHAAIVNVSVITDVVKRHFVGNITIIQGGIKYTPLYGRDYDSYTNGSAICAGFSFTTTLEANLTMPTTLAIEDTVSCRIYGHKNTTTLSAVPFGSNDSATGNLAQGIVALFKVLKNSGLTESEINLTEFTTLQISNTDTVGFCIPQFASNDFPTYKSLVEKFSQTLLLKIFQDNNLKWEIKQTEPLPAYVKQIDDIEIMAQSWSYDLEYTDIISEVIVQYAAQEINDKGAIAFDGAYRAVNATSDVARYLHGIDRQKSFYSLHFEESQAQTLANRLSYALGDRQGIVYLNTKNRFFDSLIGDTIRVSRTRLLGSEYDSATERTRDFSVTSTGKSLNNVKIELYDQKGIEDNTGVW